MAEAGKGRRNRRLRRLSGWVGALLLLGVLLLLLPISRVPTLARAQVRDGQRSVVMVAGPRYRAGPLGRFLLGSRYRELWTLPVEFEVLDLDSTAGGLKALRQGGGLQTLALHLEGVTGRRFVFRSADKEARFVGRLLRRSLVARLVEDQTSSAHPASALVAAELQAALGLPTPRLRLVVLPPHPRLGRFGERFAGLPGTLEERPAPGDDPAGARLETAELLARLERGGGRIDGAGYLTARLLDFVLSDWDRHPGQWLWQAEPRGRDTLWHPVPLDRDQALAWYDGALLAAARWVKPQLTRFGPELPGLEALTRSARDLDRRILAGLPAAVWDSVARFVEQRLGDPVIAAGVARMPEGWRRGSGALVAEALRRRRDAIRRTAADYRARLATAEAGSRSAP